MSCWFASTTQYSVLLVITRKSLSELLFREINITHNVIGSNLVLIVLTIYTFLMHTFLNARKSLGGHARYNETSPFLKSIKFYLLRKRR